MRRLLPFTLCLLLPLAAGAQEAAPMDTLLSLTATGSAHPAPDQLVAELQAVATAPTPAAAQRDVNGQMARALAAARAVAGVDARAIDYAVSPADDTRTRWTAQQTLLLTGADGPALLDLTNRLQGQGLLTISLGWQLSSAVLHRAEAEATTDALAALQTRAAAAAHALGLRVVGLKRVQLQPRPFGPVRPMAMMARAAAPSPPPEATASAQEVTAQVSAEVILRP